MGVTANEQWGTYSLKVTVNHFLSMDIYQTLGDARQLHNEPKIGKPSGKTENCWLKHVPAPVGLPPGSLSEIGSCFRSPSTLKPLRNETCSSSPLIAAGCLDAEGPSKLQPLCRTSTHRQSIGSQKGPKQDLLQPFSVTLCTRTS